MRISELSDRTGVTPASIKYYTREGLLPEGRRVGYNRTEYAEHHVARLRLVRALIDVGGLSVATTRDVLDATDDPDLPLVGTLAAAHAAVPRTTRTPSAASLARVASLMRDRGWTAHAQNPGIAQTADVLDRYAEIGRDDLAEVLDRYADAADIVADADLRSVAASGTRERMAETVVVGTVLGDGLIAGLRRIAQEHLSRHRYPRPPAPQEHACDDVPESNALDSEEVPR